MGFIFGILKRVIKSLFYIALVTAIILLIPNLPPYTKFTSIELDPTQPRTGVLAPNGDLNNVEKIYIDKVVGPEAFQLWNNEVYTSLATGELVKLSRGGHVTFVTQIGQPCTGLVHEHICGRPLGFVIDDKKKQMYIADAYYGIWRVDLKSYKKNLLVSPRVAIGGRKPMFFNSVALADNGDLYWTDSSSDYQIKDGAFAIISDPSGRLFHYNPAKNESTVLLDNVWFANGLIVSPDNQFLLVVESNHMRLLKYYINGPKKGSTEVFVSGLPGTPDTVRVLPDGSGVLVALYAAFDDEHPLLLKSLANTPMARKAAARFMKLLELPFEFLNTYFPYSIFEQAVYTIGHFATLSVFGPGLSGLVQVDWNGNIVASYYNTDNSVHHISDAIVYNDKLYLGCPHMQNFIGSVPAPPLLKKAFNVAKPSSAKPVQEKQMPKKEKVVEKVKDTVKTENLVEKQPNPKISTDKTSEGNKKQADPKISTEKPSEGNKKQPDPKIIIEKPTESDKKQPKSKTATEKPSVSVKEQPNQKITTQKPSDGDKIKIAPQKQPEVKVNVTPKDVVKEAVKEESSKSIPKSTETKPLKESTTASTKSKLDASTPAQKTEVKKDGPSGSNAVPESKPKVVPKVDTKKEAAPESKVVTKSQPNVAPKIESKKDTPKTNTLKSENVPKTKISGNEKVAPKVDKPESTKAKSEKPKSNKKPEKPSVEEEPQIIVQKVVPDVIPITEDIPSDTAKPKREPLKVIKKSGPTEIPPPA